jgi:hypothetical protein
MRYGRSSLSEPFNAERGQGWRNSERKTKVSVLSRRTICFSKSDEMHDAMIELFFHQQNHAHHKF